MHAVAVATAQPHYRCHNVQLPHCGLTSGYHLWYWVALPQLRTQPLHDLSLSPAISLLRILIDLAVLSGIFGCIVLSICLRIQRYHHEGNSPDRGGLRKPGGCQHKLSLGEPYLRLLDTPRLEMFDGSALRRGRHVRRDIHLKVWIDTDHF